MSDPPRRRTRRELELELATLRSNRDLEWRGMREVARAFARLAIAGYQPDLPPLQGEDGELLPRLVPPGSMEAQELARRLAGTYLRMTEPVLPLTIDDLVAYDPALPPHLRSPR